MKEFERLAERQSTNYFALTISIYHHQTIRLLTKLATRQSWLARERGRAQSPLTKRATLIYSSLLRRRVLCSVFEWMNLNLSKLGVFHIFGVRRLEYIRNCPRSKDWPTQARSIVITHEYHLDETQKGKEHLIFTWPTLSWRCLYVTHVLLDRKKRVNHVVSQILRFTDWFLFCITDDSGRWTHRTGYFWDGLWIPSVFALQRFSCRLLRYEG